MRVSDLPEKALRKRLAREGLVIPMGPFRASIQARSRAVAQAIATLYADYPLESGDAFVDFHTGVAAPSGLRRWIRPQIRFLFDGRPPFKPLPRSQSYPALEWGLNWVLAQHTARHLVLHAAVVARQGRAVILPGPPGAGKSTLCAGLVERGWRLLSDELTLLRMDDDLVDPVPRPVALKNDSIEIIQRFSPGAVLGRRYHDTQK